MSQCQTPLSAKSWGTYLKPCDPLRDKYLFYYAYMHLLFLSGPALELKSSASRSQVYALNVHIYSCLPSIFFPGLCISKGISKAKAEGRWWRLVWAQILTLGHHIKFSLASPGSSSAESEHIFHSKDSLLVFRHCLSQSLFPNHNVETSNL